MARQLLPLFPLNSVLFPGMTLPLHIFEPRYRQLVTELEAGTSDVARSFGVIAIRRGNQVGPRSAPDLYETGTAALLRQVTPYPDGRFDIMTTGSHRFLLHSVDESRPYLTGEVEWMLDETEPAGDDDGLATRVAERFNAYRRLLASQVEDDEPSRSQVELPSNPTQLSYLLSAAMVLDLPDRQALLADATTVDRLQRLHSLLQRELTVLAKLNAVPATDLLRSLPSLN